MDEGTTGTGSKYRQIRNLADGGMGTVVLAVREEGTFRRVYALKRLLPEFRRDAKVRAMFLEEARIAGLLHHPNVVSVVDVGEDEDGPYLVMDYVPGVSLSQLITDVRDSAELIPVQVCARIIKDVAEGLHAAHELKGHAGESLELVHRDVSPQNVLVGYDGAARLTDFGIAKALGRRDRTSTGVLKGKFGYFSPEQLQFEHPTRRSDIFSLGVVLFETLAARRLYTGDDHTEIAKSILKDPPPDIDEIRSDVHPRILELLFQMLAKDPDERPETAREVAERLDAALGELVLHEGGVNPEEFVAPRFETRRQEQVEEIEQITAAVVLGPISVRPTWRRGARNAVGIAVAASLAGVMAWSLLREEPEAVTESAPAAVTAAETEAAAETVTVAERVPAPETATVADIDAAREIETAPEIETATAAPKQKAKRPRKKRTRTAKAKLAPAPKPVTSEEAKPPKPSGRSLATEELMTWSDRKR